MNNLTNLIKSEIKRQYKTQLNFAKACGIPYSTLSNVLKKGVEGTAYGTVMKICRVLDIKRPHENDEILYNDLALFSRDYRDIYTMLTALDDFGLHTVTTVLKVEYNRCIETGKGAHIEGLSGGVVGQDPCTEKRQLDVGSEVQLERVRALLRGGTNEDGC